MPPTAPQAPHAEILASTAPPEDALTPLREDLALLPGPVLPDGQPSWTLHDPARNLYLRIDWPAFEALQRWQLGSARAVADDIAARTTLAMEAEDVLEIARFLSQQQCLRPGPGQAAAMAQRQQQARGSLWSWLLHHYLFFRVPLVRPDRWLARWQGVAGLFWSPGFLGLTLGALAFGVLQVGRQWDTFARQFVDTLSLEGLAWYAVALGLVKVLHELGHAFTARRLGCRVPTIGVAFMVLWPMAYTDTNDAWRLTDARQRLQVASAGICTEMAIAAWATAAWGLLPDGPLRSAAFVLATTSWIATLAVNASPFMRFDGYFILSDALDLPNLHERCFALARWRLRETLFALGEDAPEPVPLTQRRWMIAFAWATWAYRLVLFIGIALLVYHLFFKLLGVFLFAVEIAWFIGRPLRNELRAWGERRGRIAQQGRAWVSLLVVIALVSLLFVPWPGRIGASAVLRPAEVWPVHAPSGARLEALAYADGDRVPEGALIARLHVPDLNTRRQTLSSRVAQLRERSLRAGFDAQMRERMRVDEQTLATTRAELASVDTELMLYAPRAPFAGTLRDLDPDLRPGQWLAPRERIALLVREGTPWVVDTWLDEDAVRRVAAGDRAAFVTDGASGPVLALKVQAIDRDASRTLPLAELSAAAGGHVLTRDQNGQPVPERAVYRVRLTLDAPGGQVPAALAQQSWRGTVTVHARAEAPAWRYLRQAGAVLVRELGF
jgi:putative peptide zinc metalloprotease protein